MPRPTAALGAPALLLALLLTLAVLVAAPGAQADPERLAPISDELVDALAVAGAERVEAIVAFHDRDALTLLDRLRVPYLPLRALPIAGAYLNAAEVAELRTWPQVRSVTFNAPLEYLSNQSVPATGAPEVWERGVTGEGVTIAILDTGVDGTHPDLAYPDKTVAQVKFLHTRFANWSHGNNTETVQTEVDDLPNTDTTSGHGTHVAGIAAGDGSHNAAYRGVAPGAALVGLGAGDDLFVYEALKGFDWLFVTDEDGVPNHVKHDIRVINNSWGGGGGNELDLDDPITIASYEAYRAGITVVFAGGNSGPGPDTYNARALAPWNHGVASTNKGLRLDGFSSRGYPNHPFKTPDVAAPGSGINAANFAAWPVLPYTSKSGTSMAAPHVAGLVALLLEANPDLSPDQVADIVREAVVPLESFDAEWERGSGFIDALAALELALATEGARAQFLEGDTEHTIESAAATALPYERSEERFSGTALPAGLAPDTHTFTVEEDAEFLTGLATWAGSVHDIDIILTDPDGNEFRSPTGAVDRALNALSSATVVRVVLPAPGQWTAEVRGFGTATPYTFRAITYVVDDETNWTEENLGYLP